VKQFVGTFVFLLLAIPALAQQSQYLGKLSSNRYDGASVSNPYSAYGSAYSPTSIDNSYGPYGSQFSPLSVKNPYTLNAPRLYASDAADFRSTATTLIPYRTLPAATAAGIRPPLLTTRLVPTEARTAT